MKGESTLKDVERAATASGHTFGQVMNAYHAGRITRADMLDMTDQELWWIATGRNEPIPEDDGLACGILEEILDRRTTK